MNDWIRQSHRWISLIFTGALLLIFVTQAFADLDEWVFFLPLPPLFFLLATGLYLFALPYVRRARARRMGRGQ